MRMKYILNWYTVEMQYDNQFVLLPFEVPYFVRQKTGCYNVASIWAISLESEHQTHFILCIITHNRLLM